MRLERYFPALITSASLFALGCVLPAAAQQGNAYQGVSKPPVEQMVTTPDDPQPAPAPAAQVTTSTSDTTQVTVSTQTTQTDQSAEQVAPMPQPAVRVAADPDGDIVQPRQARPGELLGGATIQVKLLDRLSSSESEKGDPFKGTVARDVVQDGMIMIPAGSGIEGKVSQVYAGKMGGHGSIRLKPEAVILPDGSRYLLRADVTGTAGSHTRMGGEGTINPGSRVGRDSIEYGAVVGVGAATGAILGGPVGAVTGGLIGAGVVTTHLIVSHPQATLEPGSVVMFTLTDSLQMAPAATN
jgi:hypothetical protein